MTGLETALVGCSLSYIIDDSLAFADLLFIIILRRIVIMDVRTRLGWVRVDTEELCVGQRYHVP